MRTKLNPDSVIMATVWSSSNCPWCDRAKQLLVSKGIPFKVLEIGKGDITKEKFFEANPGARTVPQVWLDGQLVGGFEQLKAALQ